MTFWPPVRATLLAVGLLLITLIASACSDDPATTDDAGDAGSFTDTDVSFLQGMVPHHSQAVEMAELVPDRTAHPEELGELADTIIATQQEEIDTMNGLLEQAGEDPVETGDDMGAMDMGGEETEDADLDMGGMEMSGMMAPEDMTALTEAEGDAFDGMFLEMMVAHHEGAIEAAQQVQEAEDGNPAVATLAGEIIAAQEAEITQMQGWQSDWGV